MRFANKILNSIILVSYKKKYNDFLEDTNKVKSIQKNKILNIVRKNQNSEFGKEHNFNKIHSIEEFRKQIPISDYSDYDKYIEKCKQINSSILTESKIRLFEPTSGSISATKLIPYTNELKKEFLEGIEPWIYNLYTKNKKLQEGKSYWSISPLIDKKSKTKSGIPIGFEDDTSYLGDMQKVLYDKIVCVPSEVKYIADIDDFRYVSQLFLLKNKELSFISIWHPSFLPLLFTNFGKNVNQLCKDLTRGKIDNNVDLPNSIRKILNKKLGKNKQRAKEIQKIVKENQANLYEILFPNLELISCWTDGNSKEAIPQLKNMFPNIKIQGKGLIATECFVSFPLVDVKYPVLSINSHFFEFIELNEDLKDKEIKLAHQLEINKLYIPIITTSGGFYRYNINDVIKVKGFLNKTPLIEFIGKYDNVSDYTGEKLNEVFVRKSLVDIFERKNIKPEFFILAPVKENNRYNYVLFIQTNSKIDNKLSEIIDNSLRNNFHYNNSRKLNQLGKIKIFNISKEGMKGYVEYQNKKGKKIGDIKTLTLSKDLGLTSVFKGEFV